MAYLFSNLAKTTLSAELTTGVTSASVTDGAVFEAPTGGNIERLILLDDAANPTQYEIVNVTARSGNTLTIVRAQEGTSQPASWPADTVVAARLTAGILDQFPQGFDAGGNAKGANAANLQPARSTAANVASGARSVAVGYDTRAAGAESVAIGDAAVASQSGGIAIGDAANAGSTGSSAIAIGDGADAELTGVAIGAGASATNTTDDAVAVGKQADATGEAAVVVGNNCDAAGQYGIAMGAYADASAARSIGIGYAAQATAASALALGYGAASTIEGSAHITAVPMVARTGAWGITGAGAVTGASLTGQMAASRAVLSSLVVELDATADDVATIVIPSGCHFIPLNILCLITVSNTVTVDPDIAVGTSTGGTELLASTTQTETDAYNVNENAPASKHAVAGTIYVSVKTGATATDLKGRVLIEGVLVEDE